MEIYGGWTKLVSYTKISSEEEVEELHVGVNFAEAVDLAIN